MCDLCQIKAIGEYQYHANTDSGEQIIHPDILDVGETALKQLLKRSKISSKKCFQCFWFQILRDNDSLPKNQGHAVSWKLFGGEECSEQGLKDQCKMYLMFVMFVYLMFVKVQFEASEDSPTSDNASLSSR